MRHRKPINADAPLLTVIYCRVSSKKQDIMGDGLASQETRLREDAARKGYDVVRVFRDKLTGGEHRRPGLREMVEFVMSDKKNRYRIFFDHIDRFVRDTFLHKDLRRELEARAAILESPDVVYTGDASSRLLENITVTFADYHRVNNAEQTLNRMQARLKNGFAVFAATSGYRYGRVSGFNGKVLIRQEPQATVLTEALEGYASGRFDSQAHVVDFLNAHPLYPKPKSGVIPHQRVCDILRNCIYAGYVEAPQWDITRRKGHHEALISLATFERIQDRLNGIGRAAYRTDLSTDFPLRGFVHCDDCSGFLTACWSTSGGKEKKRHAYYQCPKKGCASYGKTIRREAIEGEFETILRHAQPQPQLFDVMTAMFRDLWDRRQANTKYEATALKAALGKVEQQIDQTVERIVETNVSAVTRALEAKVVKLEKEKLLIAERIAQGARPAEDFDKKLRTALGFLANPCSLWDSGRIEDRRAVLKLTFADRLRYKRGEGFRTANLALPFRVLAVFYPVKM